MGRVKIVTDSTADIPKDLVKKYDITVVPLKVAIGNETFQDGVNLTTEAFYQKIESSEELPSTSQPTPYEFETVYRRIAENEADEVTILSIHLSSQLSGTMQSATLAAEEVKDAVHVDVVDSKRASYAIGIIVVEIAKLAQDGADVKACKERLNTLLEETKVYFLVNTLEYLQKNGRIGKASALFGTLLKVKPVLSLSEDGQVYPYFKARGRKKALAAIREAVNEQYGSKPVHIGICHANALESGEELLEKTTSSLQVESTTITEIGAVIGSHVGPESVAVTVMPAK
ncbi:EDD domain protein, DegV family [Alteribacillus persepolensis]|uniref:EDD domain protein, DegV family n=1 Tax=Alteribacillus persepolensis TaxID=568899 RepID=A0A1G7YJ86_9BACI|nr:DegV family protein [Alteribacillus persepolensis]SDG96601.1 EDD domain protein, DegV family [Alteribacillus persepolensis]